MKLTAGFPVFEAFNKQDGEVTWFVRSSGYNNKKGWIVCAVGQ